MAIVRYTLETLPPVSQEELDRVHAIRDEDIDCSDMPEIGKHSGLIPRAQYEAWKKARLEAASKLEAVWGRGYLKTSGVPQGSGAVSMCCFIF